MALGFLASRAHAGFFVKQPRHRRARRRRASAAELRFDARWYLQARSSRTGALRCKPGCGWLPNDWLFVEGVERSLRQLRPTKAIDARRLRRAAAATWRCAQLIARGAGRAPDRGHRRAGAAHAGLEPGAGPRRAPAGASPGDAVLVDDPGYPNLMFHAALPAARGWSACRARRSGYDLAALEALHRRSTGRRRSSRSRGCRARPIRWRRSSQLYRVLQLAEKHDFTGGRERHLRRPRPGAQAVAGEPRPAAARDLRRQLLEDDLAEHPGRLPGRRRPTLLDDLAQLKMLSGLTSSEFTERLAYGALHRRPLAQAPERRCASGLAQAHQVAAAGCWNSASSCSASRRRACTCGRAIRRSRAAPSCLTRRRSTTSCWARAPVFDRPRAERLAAVQRRLLHGWRGVFFSRARSVADVIPDSCPSTWRSATRSACSAVSATSGSGSHAQARAPALTAPDPRGPTVPPPPVNQRFALRAWSTAFAP